MQKCQLVVNVYFQIANVEEYNKAYELITNDSKKLKYLVRIYNKQNEQNES